MVTRGVVRCMVRVVTRGVVVVVAVVVMVGFLFLLRWSGGERGLRFGREQAGFLQF